MNDHPDSSTARARRESGVDDGTMRAIVQDSYGAADVLRLDRDRPARGRRRRGAGARARRRARPRHLAPDDRQAVPAALLGFGLRGPKNPVPGRDVAGTVVAVGLGGDQVRRRATRCSGSPAGSFAEYAVAREDKLAPKPANLTFEQAAVVPISAAPRCRP